MKKTALRTVLLFVLLTSLLMLSTAAVTGAAADDNSNAPTFESALFPSGVSAPAAPYIEVVSNEAGSEDNARMNLWFGAPAEIRNACIAYRDTLDEYGNPYCFDAFTEKYGIDNWWFYCQFDVSIDGGAWAASEEWDECDSGCFEDWLLPQQIYVGERCDCSNVGYTSTGVLWAEDAYDRDGTYHDITVPYTNGYGEEVYHFDLENHTIAVRARYVVRYTAWNDEDGWTYSYVVGPWSPTASVGRNGNQKATVKPAVIPVPAVADFDIIEPEDGFGDPYLSWSMNNTYAYNDIVRWLIENGPDGNSLYFEGEMRVNNGEWVEMPMSYNNIDFGTHSSYATDQLHSGCHVDARFRVGCDETGWSDWTSVFSAGAELYCNHPTWGTWHVCPENAELCERICTVCGYKDTKWHAAGDPVVLKQPTCTTEGTRQYTCIDCGAKWTNPIPTNDAHVYGAWVKKDDACCIRTCTLCKTATETKGHYFVMDLSRSVPATCGHEGSETYVCADCGFEKVEPVAKLTTHRFELTGNESSYWHSVGLDKPHERVCPDCGLKETAAHTFNSGTVTKKATCAEEGVKTFSCTVCGESYDEPIAKTKNHSYAAKWTTDKSAHWHECSVCHDKKDYAFHTPGPEPTESSAQLCTVCSYVIKPKLDHHHDVTTGWTFDEKGHWHYCTGCGEKSAYAAHTFGSDCDETCDICGYRRTVTHVPGEGWIIEAEGHSHACGKCGARLDFAAHVPGPAATESAPQVCTVCGYIMHPVLDHVHVWDDKYTFDGTDHWVACRGCDEIKAKAAHVYDNACDPTCNICGNLRSTSHNEGGAWESDGTSHWHTCTVCGEKLNTAAHTYENACDPDCNVCHAERKIQHQFETTWKGDDGAHWHACSVCGKKSDAAAHVFDDDYDPTCNVCGYTRTVPHRYSEAWKHNDTQHWHECTDCDAMSDKADHVFDNACDPSCNVCGYTRSITHKTPAAWTADDTQHWHICTICAAELDRAEHIPGEPATAARDQVCTVCGHVIAKATGVWESNADGHWSTGSGSAGSGDFAAHDFDASGVCAACGYLKVKDTEAESDTAAATTSAAPETDTEPATAADTASDTAADTAAESDVPAEPDTENTIGTVGELQTLPESDTGSGDEGGGKKCRLCGFCPCPLHICIFIWLLILLIIIAVVLFFIFRKRKCPQCGEKVSRKEKTCPKCGAPLGKSGEGAKDEQTEQTEQSGQPESTDDTQNG